MVKTTRRGFLQGTALGGAALTSACATPPRETGTSTHAEDIDAPDAHAGARVSLRTTINTQPHTLEVDADRSTLTLVREQLGLTGAKLGCGHGACGACTMQLDGVPVATCLLPATALEGRSLTTVEGLTGGAGLHAIQRAFMAEDALQCGYCTPGFIVEAAAFVEGFRASAPGGMGTPSSALMAEALAGHLCRCGAYAAIYRAVRGACEGRFDSGPDHGPRVDALAKVTGAAKYTVDIALEGMLVAKILRSPHAHATLRKLDYGEALASPGVHGAVELTSAGQTIRYVGQELVALAAESEDCAREALAKVRVEYELHDALIGIDAALAPAAAEVYASKKVRRRAPNANEAPLLPETWSGNLRGPFTFMSHKAGAARRRVAAARKQDPSRVFSGSFETQVQVHSSLEPRAVVAAWDTSDEGDDQLRVHVSTQAVRHFADDLAQRLKLSRDQVEVIAHYVGGGFGAKNVVYLELMTAIELARTCGRPVKLVNERREEITVGGSRPGVRATVELADDERERPAIVVAAQSDAGVAVGSAVTAMVRLHYPDAALALADYDVINHAAPGCPFRGPGGPPAFFALEQSIDQLAHDRGLDPLALRQRWNNGNEARERVFAWAAELPLWRDRPAPGQDRGRYRRGIGLATATWFCLMEPATRVRIDAGPEGITVSSAGQDIGTGSRTLLADVVAEVLGVDPHALRIELGSSRGVHGPMAGGSRSAGSLGPAASDAAEQLRDELTEQARERLDLIDAVAVPGGVAHRDGKLSWAQVLELGPTHSFTGKRGRDEGGFYLPPIAGTAFSRYLSAAAQVCQVEVDTRLGRVRVLETHFAASIGRVYSPVLARSQAEGGLTQGIGYALYEERRLDPRDGRVLTGNLEDYRVCGLGDVGEMHVEFLPGGFEKVRGRGVGIGELCTLAPAACIANAVYAATLWRPMQLPLRPDRVLAGLAAAAHARAGAGAGT